MTLKKIITLLVGTIFIFGSYLFLDTTNGTKIVKIKSGMSASAVSDLLKEEGILTRNNSLLFYVFLRVSGKAGSIKAGSYRIEKGMKMLSIIKLLTTGSNVFINVTIPEGFTSEQISMRLKENGIIEDERHFLEMIKSLDIRGFLFPETYKLTDDMSPAAIIKMMKVQFEKIYSEEFRSRESELGLDTHKVVTLASLVEKEARVPQDRPVISAIFHKRLNKRMYLESCASVLFALGKHKEKLRYKDLEVESPYNTYRNFGLPPTPICNPGEDSIRAALWPADTDYLYFFARGDGSHIFSKTYEDHLRLQREFKNSLK